MKPHKDVAGERGARRRQHRPLQAATPPRHVAHHSQGIQRDERGQDQPADKSRAQQTPHGNAEEDNQEP